MHPPQPLDPQPPRLSPPDPDPRRPSWSTIFASDLSLGDLRKFDMGNANHRIGCLLMIVIGLFAAPVFLYTFLMIFRRIFFGRVD